MDINTNSTIDKTNSNQHLPTSTKMNNKKIQKKLKKQRKKYKYIENQNKTTQILFCSNINHQVNHHQLVQLFSNFGKVLYINLMVTQKQKISYFSNIDSPTGITKTAEICFQQEEKAIQALQCLIQHEVRMYNEMLEITYLSQKNVNKFYSKFYDKF